MDSEEFLKKCEEYFDTSDFYEVLQVDKGASAKEIKKAYYKLSLLVHPDRVEEHKKVRATEQFKVLSKIHSILQNKEKRKIYDDCGDFEDDNDATFNWTNYWRSMFKKITTEDIDKYKAEYINSEKEKLDIKKAYINGKGSMDFMFEMVPFIDCDSEPRVIEIVQKMVDDGEVERMESFFNEPKKKKQKRFQKWKKEKEEAEKLNVSDQDLAMKIEKRQQERVEAMADYFEMLEEKYAPKNQKAKRKSVKDAETKVTKRPKRAAAKN